MKKTRADRDGWKSPFWLFLALLLMASPAFAFSFSEYDREEEKEATTPAATEKLAAVSCPDLLKSRKIALVIAEEGQAGRQQGIYRPFFQVINQRLQRLGLQTYSPEQIDQQITEGELQGFLQGDSQAALSASRRLGASYFIRGLLTARDRVNPLLNLPEIFVTMDFSLSDAQGNLISEIQVSSAAFSGADTLAAALELVGKDADRIVATLYEDYCAWGTRNLAALKAAQKADQPRPTAAGADRPVRQEAAAAAPQAEKAGEVKTIIVSAEGLADPSSSLYRKDKGLMIEHLRQDARRQAIEKAVGTFVDSATLVENYLLISDRVMTRSTGLIKRVIEESSPWQGEDGLMHILLKAEVFLSEVEEALASLSREQKLNLIRAAGNPTISVAIQVRDAERGHATPPEHSVIAEDILKQKFKNFGYRVWSEEYTRQLKGKEASDQRREADFSVLGEVKFSTRNLQLPRSGVMVTRHNLTSWAIKCINNHTGEEIYFNYQIPARRSWDSEDEALQEIGRLLGEEFNQGFFSSYLNQPSTIFQMEVSGLPDYEIALLLKKELLGFRPVLNLDLRDFKAGSLSQYEVDFVGSSGDFAGIIHNTVLSPLNTKLGGEFLTLTAKHGNVVRIAYNPVLESSEVKQKLETLPPASLSQAPAARVEAVVQDEALLQKIEAQNPVINEELAEVAGGESSSIIQNF